MKTNREILKQYQENEELNLHSENLLLLATHFGTPSQILEAERQARAKRSDAYPRYEMPAYEARAINSYYYTKLPKKLV